MGILHVTGWGKPEGRVLWHLPASPGKQREQGLPDLAQVHLRHFAEPLHLQQRRMGAPEEGAWTGFGTGIGVALDLRRFPISESAYLSGGWKMWVGEVQHFMQNICRSVRRWLDTEIPQDHTSRDRYNTNTVCYNLNYTIQPTAYPTETS